MRIIIDARTMYWTGVGRYILALLEELQEIDAVNQYFVLMRRKDWDLWEPNAANFSKIEVNINPYTLAEQFWLLGVLKGLNPDLVHFTTPNAPVLWLGHRALTVHDLTLVDYDTGRRGGLRGQVWQLKRLVFRLVLRANVAFATQVITDTAFVKEQLERRYRLTPARVTVALLATDEQVATPLPLNRLQLSPDYLLYVGNAYPYKNIGSTIEAIAQLPSSLSHVELVVAGKRDTFSAGLEQLATRLGVADRVRFIGYVNDGELISLYRGARAYVYPSLSEGFGLQGLEAMAQGLPVVASRASCLPEVYADAAEYFDPSSAADQAATITRVLTDPERAAALRDAGKKRVKQFSWKRMAEQTLAVYKKSTAAR